MDDVADVAFGCFGLAIALCLAGVLFWAALETIDSLRYDRASFAAQAACKAKRGLAERKFLSTDVVCVPSLARQDTTTVQVRQ